MESRPLDGDRSVLSITTYLKTLPLPVPLLDYHTHCTSLGTTALYLDFVSGIGHPGFGHGGEWWLYHGQRHGSRTQDNLGPGHQQKAVSCAKGGEERLNEINLSNKSMS